MEQLAPILNPREGPPEWYRVCADAGGGFYEKGDKSGISVDAVGGEALVLRVLLDLNGSPEVRRLVASTAVGLSILWLTASRG